MSKAGSAMILEVHEIERRILVVRGQRVMLDSDLAKLHRISTAALNMQSLAIAAGFLPILRISLHSRSLQI